MNRNYTQTTASDATQTTADNWAQPSQIRHDGAKRPGKADGVPENIEGTTASLCVAEAIAHLLAELGVRHAFGVSGGAMATLWAALSNHPHLEVLHCRHEGGAAFAAAEAHFASGRPAVVFTTAGPGITNALTGLLAARDEGAKVIHLSACTSAPQRGRWAIQETSAHTIPQTGIFTTGALFNYATIVECPEQLPTLARRLALGLAQPGRFVAHISIPTNVQSLPIAADSLPQLDLTPNLPVPSEDTMATVAQLLSAESFALWLGFGARGAASEIRQLAERTGAAVMCSPRGKGIFPETHPQFVGVTGLGGHESVNQYLQRFRPQRILVVGTRLGEPTSFWSQEMIPPQGFVHVDIDPHVPGVAYPNAKTLALQAEAKVFVRKLLKYFPQGYNAAASQRVEFPNPEYPTLHTEWEKRVRPQMLMAAIQQCVVEGSDAMVLAESGNSFTWATHWLRFGQPNRYRVSTGVGSMGHNATGIIGAACAGNGKAVAIVGDGAMLMSCGEISTAVKYQLPAVWIILNDARYNMCRQGMALLGLAGADALMPQTNFIQIAYGMGAKGIRVARESDLPIALKTAMAATEPFIVDVLIDPEHFAPSKGRNQSLSTQGISKPATRTTDSQEKHVSFPLV